MATEQPEKRVFTTQVRTFDGSDFKMEEKPLVYPGTDTPNGIGEFIDGKAYDQYIKQTYGEQIAELDKNPEAEVSEELILFEVGKTVIQMILAQEACEGIRLIAVKTNGKNGMRNSFILEGITKDMHEGGVAASVQGLDGSEAVKSEEVHGSKLRDVFRFLKSHKIVESQVSIDDFIDVLRKGSKGL